MRLPRSILAAIAAPAIPIAGVGLPLVILLPKFYSENTALSLAVAGSVFFVARIFDIVVDPIFGVVADKVRVPLGRRKFWLLVSIPILLLSVFKVFIPPADAGYFYLLSWLLLVYLGYTLVTISIVSWSAELSTDYHERTRVQAWYQTSLMIGLITVLIVPVIVGGQGGDNRAQTEAVGWFIMILVVPTVLFAVLRVPETPVREDLGTHWREAFAALLRSRPLRFLIGADLMFGFATGVAGALYLFAIQYGLGLTDGQSKIVLLVYFVVACLFVPLWPGLGRRWEKHKVLAWAAIYSLAAPFAYFLVPHGSMIGALIVTGLFGIPYAAARVLLKSMMADVTDDDRLKSGRMQAGIFFSLLLTTEKLGVAVAALSLAVLQAIGFTPNTTNDSTALLGLMLLFAAAPAIFHGFAALILWRYPLGRAQQAQMRAEIAARFGE